MGYNLRFRSAWVVYSFIYLFIYFYTIGVITMTVKVLVLNKILIKERTHLANLSFARSFGARLCSEIGCDQNLFWLAKIFMRPRLEENCELRVVDE